MDTQEIVAKAATVAKDGSEESLFNPELLRTMDDMQCAITSRVSKMRTADEPRLAVIKWAAALAVWGLRLLAAELSRETPSAATAYEDVRKGLKRYVAAVILHR